MIEVYMSFKGYRMTDEHKRKIGAANALKIKKLWRNPEYRKRMSEAHKGKKFPHMFQPRPDMIGNKFAVGHRPQNWKGGKETYHERRVIYTNNRRSLLYSSKERLTLHEWQLIKAEYNYKCACCGKIKKLTIDHIMPLSRGGQHNRKNIQPLCMPCNRLKFIKTIKF